MSETDRWALPLVEAGQAQKEMTHNEALARLDLLTAASVESVGLNTPPAAPSPGQCWVVGPAPTGAWIGHADALAGWTGGGWRFVTVREGLRVWSVADRGAVTFVDGAWRRGVVIAGTQVVGQQRPAIAMPAGGATVDAEARAVLDTLLSALRAHGLIAT